MSERELSSMERMRISDGAGRDQFSSNSSQAYRISARFCSSNAIEYGEDLVDGFYCITFGMEYFPHCFGKEPLPSLENLRREAPESSSDLREVRSVGLLAGQGNVCFLLLLLLLLLLLAFFFLNFWKRDDLKYCHFAGNRGE